MTTSRKDQVAGTVAAILFVGAVLGNAYGAWTIRKEKRLRICVAATRDLDAGTVLRSGDSAIRIRPIEGTDYFDDLTPLMGRQLSLKRNRGEVINRTSLVADRFLCPVDFTVAITLPAEKLKAKQHVILFAANGKAAPSRVFTVKDEPTDNTLRLHADYAEDMFPLVAGGTQTTYRVVVVAP